MQKRLEDEPTPELLDSVAGYLAELETVEPELQEARPVVGDAYHQFACDQRVGGEIQATNCTKSRNDWHSKHPPPLVYRDLSIFIVQSAPLLNNSAENNCTQTCDVN